MKPFNFFLLVPLIICSFNLVAQDQYHSVERQLNISILYPGVSAELPLSDNFSVVPKVGLGIGFSAYYSSFGGGAFDYVVAPACNIQGRFYYNGLKKITRKGRKLFRNSGNYAFAQVGGNLDPIAFSSIEGSARLSIGLGWGMQRIYRNNVLLSWGIGLGYDSFIQTATWINEFTLGYVIRPKTKDEIIDF